MYIGSGGAEQERYVVTAGFKTVAPPSIRERFMRWLRVGLLVLVLSVSGCAAGGLVDRATTFNASPEQLKRWAEEVGIQPCDDGCRAVVTLYTRSNGFGNGLHGCTCPGEI